MDRMSTVKLIAKYAIAYLMWIVSFLLWLWFMFISRGSIVSLMTKYYLDGSLNRSKAFDFINQWYFYFLGLVWLVLMIVVENYFRQGFVKGHLFRRICQWIGPEVILLALANFARAFAATFTIQDWLIAGIELILGAGMIWYTVKTKPPTPGLLTKKASA